MLQYLQQHQPNLTPQQASVLQQLTTQYRLMQQHQQQQQQIRLQLQQRQQQQASGQVVSSRLVGGSQQPPQQQQFIGQQQQQQSGFQQTAPRVPQSGTIAQTGFAIDNAGNFPAATGHTLPNAGMPYKSANVGSGGFNQFNSNLGYTQITSTTNQSDMGEYQKKNFFF